MSHDAKNAATIGPKIAPKIITSSLWATASFIFATLCNFAISVIVTRYFGKAVYGQYSYFLWLTSVIAILAGFGLQQTLTKFLPKYFFDQKSAQAADIFRKLLKIQIIGTIIISAICILAVSHFEKLIQFPLTEKTLLLILTFLAVLPVSLNNFLTASLTAIQEFKKLSRTYIVTSFINLVGIILLVANQASIINFLLFYTIFSLFSSVLLLIQSRQLFIKSAAPPTEKLFSYSAYAFISILCTQIVWERSEIFFLGLFSDSNQIAIYTLAYALAILFIGLWGPANGVINATFAEAVLTEKHAQINAITQQGTKYLAMLILPMSLIACLFIGDVVTAVYGESFRQVALLFPPLVISHVIAVIITPAGSIPMLKHEIRRTMIFNITTAILNLMLDFYLITRFQAVGAMLANVISQFFSITLCLINAKKYRLKIFNKYMLRVFAANIAMAIIFYFLSAFSLSIRISATFIIALIYIYFVIKKCSDQNDRPILKKLFSK